VKYTSQRRRNTARFHLDEVFEIVKFKEVEQNDGCQEMEGGGNGELLFNKVAVM